MKVTPTVTYIDIPAQECRQMLPITPPLSPVNLTDVCEHLQREIAAADEEVERMLPQVTPIVTSIPVTVLPAA